MIALCFLAPSWASVFNCYFANLIAQVISYNYAWKQIVPVGDHPGLIDQFSYWYVSIFFVTVMMFVLQQRRELKQFFLIQDLKKKQVQMINVFNAQSDAVVVVDQDSCTPNQQSEQQGCGEIQATQKPSPQFLFSNRESIELFGTDLLLL